MIVVTSASEIRGTMQTYVRQLSAAGIEVCLVHPSELACEYFHGSIGLKLRIFRKYAERFKDHDFIIFSDAFDVTFYGTRKDLLDRIPVSYVLQAAERNFHPPDVGSAENVPGDGPWKFANGGLVAGTPSAFLVWADACERHPNYDPHMIDQGFMNKCLIEGYECGWQIDSATNLFFCLYGGYEELAFERERPLNTLYGSRPLFVHANGSWNTDRLKEMSK